MNGSCWDLWAGSGVQLLVTGKGCGEIRKALSNDSITCKGALELQKQGLKLWRGHLHGNIAGAAGGTC